MKHFAKFSTLILAAVALVAAGCQKTPTRPTPMSTVPMGPSPGGNGPGFGGPRGVPTQIEGLTDRPAGFNADGLLEGEKIGLIPVYFGFDRSDIEAAERPKLQKVAEYMKANPDFKILLEGHCDWRGTAEYNLALGDRRAAAAKKFLESLGVSPDRLETLSKGSLDAPKNASEDQMKMDRRAGILVSNKK